MKRSSKGKGQKCWVCGAWHYNKNIAELCLGCMEYLAIKTMKNKGAANVRQVQSYE